jgi:hypothetical protein
VFHQLAALNPDGPIPLKILSGPILVNPGIHIALHGEHVSKRLFQSYSSLDGGSVWGEAYQSPVQKTKLQTTGLPQLDPRCRDIIFYQLGNAHVGYFVILAYLLGKT